MTDKAARKQEAQKRAAIRKAIKQADGLIIKDGPLQSLNEKDSLEIRLLRRLAAKIMGTSQDCSLLTKGHRVYYTCPIKFDCTEPPYSQTLAEETLAEGEVFSRQQFPAIGPTPVGIESAFTQAVREFEPIFEKISNEELDSRFEAFDNALIMRLLELPNGYEFEYWCDAVLIPLQVRPPRLMRSAAVEAETVDSFKDHIINPNRRIFEEAGLEVKYAVAPGIASVRPDLIVQIEGQHAQKTEFESKRPGLFEFESPTCESLLICKSKRRGLGKLIGNGEIIDSSALHSLLRECLLYMLAYKIDVVLLTDFETSILLELNFPDTRKRKLGEGPTGPTKRKATEAEELTRKDPKYLTPQAQQTGAEEHKALDAKGIEVPLRYRIIDIEDTTYTLQAVLGSTVYSKLKSKERSMEQIAALRDRVLRTEDEFVEADKRADQKDGNEKKEKQGSVLAQISKQKRSTYRDINLKGIEGLTVLQEGYERWSQVFKLSKNIAPLVFTWLKGDIQSNMVLKIYDFWRIEVFYAYADARKVCTYDEFCDDAESKAVTEIECYLRIEDYNDRNSNKIKSPKLYDCGNMYIRRDKDVRLGSVLHRGPYLLVEYMVSVDDVPISTIEEDGINQLKLLHSIGIKHGSVYPRNYVAWEDGVHFFDFSSARLYPEEVPEWEAEGEFEQFKAKIKRP